MISINNTLPDYSIFEEIAFKAAISNNITMVNQIIDYISSPIYESTLPDIEFETLYERNYSDSAMESMERQIQIDPTSTKSVRLKLELKEMYDKGKYKGDPENPNYFIQESERKRLDEIKRKAAAGIKNQADATKRGYIPPTSKKESTPIPKEKVEPKQEEIKVKSKPVKKEPAINFRARVARRLYTDSKVNPNVVTSNLIKHMFFNGLQRASTFGLTKHISRAIATVGLKYNSLKMQSHGRQLKEYMTGRPGGYIDRSFMNKMVKTRDNLNRFSNILQFSKRKG